MNRTMRINRLSDKVEVLQCTEWMGDCNISHFMTTRFGGVSLGNFSGMNAGLYTEDAPEHVRENIRLLCDALHLSPERLFMPHQTHGAQIRILNEDFLNRSEEEQVRELEGIDALVTDVREVCVAITTADCVPVLIYAPDKQVIAAVGYNTERGTETLLTLCFAVTVQESWCLRGIRLPKCTWKSECACMEKSWNNCTRCAAYRPPSV